MVSPDHRFVCTIPIQKMSSQGTRIIGMHSSLYFSFSHRCPSHLFLLFAARIEADMQVHPVCPDWKVLNLTDIIASLEAKFPEPPVRALFLPINKIVLEKEGYENKEHPEKTNWIAVKNLEAFNHVLEHGLWNGTVKVFQMGTTALKGTKFENRRSIAGSLLDYFIALEAKVFVGTPVSSFSHSLMAQRFYRQDYNNWQYLPDGLHLWTPYHASGNNQSTIRTMIVGNSTLEIAPKKAPPFEC